MIRIMRKRGGQGHGMYRAYCDECTKWLHGHGRSAYLTWWNEKRGAAKASDHHQLQHEALKTIGKKPNKHQDPTPNSGEWLDVSAIPTISATITH